MSAHSENYRLSIPMGLADSPYGFPEILSRKKVGKGIEKTLERRLSGDGTGKAAHTHQTLPSFERRSLQALQGQGQVGFFNSQPLRKIQKIKIATPQILFTAEDAENAERQN